MKNTAMLTNPKPFHRHGRLLNYLVLQAVELIDVGVYIYTELRVFTVVAFCAAWNGGGVL